jgi:N6-adenosine-specific RNA methylase IME4
MMMIRRIGQDYLAYLRANAHRLDYVLIDPPWHYGAQSDAYTFNPDKIDVTEFVKWGENNEQELVRVLENLDPTATRAVCVWATIPMIKHVFGAAYDQRHPFRYRSMITWEKLTSRGNPAHVVAYYFMNTTEHLVVLFNESKPAPIPRTNIKTCRRHRRVTTNHTTRKPKDLEANLIDAWPGRWAYLFSGPYVDQIDLSNGTRLDAVDICFKREIGEMAYITSCVVVESPYAGNIKRNLHYLNACFTDCLMRGESPIASHKLFADVCCGQGPERQVGIEAGVMWGSCANYVVAYVDFGVTDGMKKAIEAYKEMGMKVEYRSLQGYNEEVSNVADCKNCGLPLDTMNDGEPRILYSCPGCGLNLDKPVKVGRQIEGLPDQPAKKYRKLLEDQDEA